MKLITFPLERYDISAFGFRTPPRAFKVRQIHYEFRLADEVTDRLR
jgi:hypothetical protein